MQEQGKTGPVRSRPHMPDSYGIVSSEESMLQWGQVDEWLTGARIYWLGTASLDGEPHATPIWGAWYAGRFYFDGNYGGTVWGRNLAANPRIVVHIESGSYVVMLKGVAQIVDVSPEAFAEINGSYLAKYNQPADTPQGIYSVQPRTVFAWDNENFTATATRWRFGED